jgi:spermidine/putrescine transport system permease protein
VRRSAWLWSAALLGYAFLYAPLVVVVAYSFNDSVMNAQWAGFTLNWYRKLFANEEMLTAAWNSLLIGLIASLVSTVLGTMAGYAMYRYRLRVLPVLVVAPIAIPEILMGVSLLIFFVTINLTLGLISIVLAHIAFCIGFVAIVVRARLAGMDESLVEAARDLGASPFQAFRLVTLPLIMPGVIAGALMAFTLSIDDFVITFFTAAADQDLHHGQGHRDARGERRVHPADAGHPRAHRHRLQALARRIARGKLSCANVALKCRL